MTASTEKQLNQLITGSTYRATTTAGLAIIGEYLGMEVPYGDWSILLRGPLGTESITVDLIESITAEAA